MRIEVLTPDEITKEEIEAFWKQGVCMDDWDYLVVAPVSTLAIEKEWREGYDYDTGRNERREVETVMQTEYLLERLLTGCCSNDWYKATFRGQECAIGVAYHA